MMRCIKKKIQRIIEGQRIFLPFLTDALIRRVLPELQVSGSTKPSRIKTISRLSENDALYSTNN